MSTDESVTVACPSCGKLDSIEYDNGDRLCLSCRHEWDPRDKVTAQTLAALHRAMTDEEGADVADILTAPTAADILGPPTVPQGVWRTDESLKAHNLDTTGDWSEQFAQTKGGDTFLVSEDEGTGIIRGYGVDGTLYEVPKTDCVLIGDDEVQARDLEGIPPTAEDEPLIPVILAVAGLALTVAMEALPTEEGGNWGHARIGWAPPPANEVPELEQGVIYAIVSIVTTFGIDRAELEKLAANLLVGADGGTDNEGQG